MAERNIMPVWTNVPPTVHELMRQYLIDHDQTISEFVRACIIGKLLDAGYMNQEILEQVAV